MLEKQTLIDKIEILEDGVIQIREVTRILENGKVIASKNTNRRIIEPDQDISKEDQTIKDIASVVRTPEKVQAYSARKAEQIQKMNPSKEK
jgi:hypothetical protein